ncbi:probable crossover junction endonuclease EME2 isoform X2 [Lampris incognitus]|uniref:probable crossover junction endonuclease EME2 isoform X2 n=1 Tax=Lampris incognitus TaxID=2546036 RepID=UPI0024B4D25A|nr:probable crossover junction endonuclease EME2 isoform X2 [Lampris incognitus]
MSGLRRAETWEISDSEDETDDKPGLTRAHRRHGETPDADAESADTDNEDRGRKYEGRPPPPPRSAPSARRRRTREEVEAERRDARERREARKRQRTAKAREKEEKRQEQKRRREAAEHLNSLRPDNCLKCLTVWIDPAVLQHDGSDVLLGTLASLEWKFNIKSQRLPHSITWTRKPPPGEDKIEPVKEEHVVVVLDLTEFMDMMMGVKKILETEDTEAGEESFFGSLMEYLNHNAEKMVTILVMTSQPNYWMEAWKGHPPYQTLRSQMGMDALDIEEVLVYLQFYQSVSLVFLDGWQEVTDHVRAVTKSLSKRPFRRLTERVELPFCVDGSWASGSRVERDGFGLSKVWSQQIQQLNRVSAAVASAITAAYPSPQLLLQAYRSAESEEARRSLLACLTVTGGGQERRVGPEISTRIYRCLTAQNPQLVLD